MTTTLYDEKTGMPVDDVRVYDRCWEKYAGRGLQPCNDCSGTRRTACMKIRSIRLNNKQDNANG